MKRAGMCLAVLFSAAWSAAPARADIETGDHLVHMGVGLSVPLTDMDTSMAGGGMEKIAYRGVFGGAQYVHHVSPSFGLGLDLSGAVHEKANHVTPTRFVETNSTVLVFQGIMRYVFFPEDKITPFLFGGFGFNRFRGEVKAVPRPGNPWTDAGGGYGERTLFDRNSLGMAASLGGGAEYYITEKLFLNLDGRWIFCAIPADTFGANSANFTATTLRLGWKFGRSADR
ncbi:MAG: outer membrane beta-barrel protein [Elusimicrobia bacterium]|nr:outer membrane beta-barrel protein [Elusimicrobiota bacterium]